MADNDAAKTSEDLADVLKDLALRIDRLKQLYEQYFMGIERMEPMVARKEVSRAMIALQQSYIRNTGLRFKFNTMLQKWSSYTTYWNRTLREIENGTYVRHLQKAARAAKAKGDALPAEMRVRSAAAAIAEEQAAADKAAAERAEVARLAAEAAQLKKAAPQPSVVRPPPIPGMASRPGGPPPIPAPGAARTPPLGAPKLPPPIPGAPRPSPPVAAAPVPGMSESELRALHKKYSEARSAAGDTAPVRYETLVASLAKQVPKVLEQPGVRGVKFDVQVQGGKAVLKAIPTK